MLSLLFLFSVLCTSPATMVAHNRCPNQQNCEESCHPDKCSPSTMLAYNRCPNQRNYQKPCRHDTCRHDKCCPPLNGKKERVIPVTNKCCKEVGETRHYANGTVVLVTYQGGEVIEVDSKEAIKSICCEAAKANPSVDECTCRKHYEFVAAQQLHRLREKTEEIIAH